MRGSVTGADFSTLCIILTFGTALNAAK